MERTLGGRYRVGPKIGDGGMAIVYRGFDTLLNRRVAIKVLRDQYAANRTFVARFEREAQAVAALVHPNIINIFDVGFDDDGPEGPGLGHYFVMELIEGPNLKELARAHGPLPIEEIVAILTQVLSGLGYAHARALVHRDIKPQNIMLTPDGVAKVTDFGIAKGSADTTLTEVGFGMGTVHYISPEVAQGLPATPAADLYAVGVMLYELLTGVLPFTGDSTVGVALKHVQEPPLSPQRLNPELPAPLAAIALRALAKDPADRFADAREMAAALADWPHFRDRRAATVAAVAPPRRPARGRTTVAAVAPPVAAAQRPHASRSAPPRQTRGGVGCLTWLTGGVALAALVALLVVGYRLSPFGLVAAEPTPPIIAGLPTEPPEPPTATREPEATPTEPPPPTANLPAPAPATPTGRPAGTPTTRPTPPPTATIPATTAPTVAPTVAPTAAVTAAPAVAATPTARPAPTATATAALVGVPDLTGKTLPEAVGIAREVGLVVEQIGAGYSARPVGQIIEQRPESGSRLARGGTIGVILSRGPQTIQIPDVKGQGYDQAAATLERAGFVPARKDVPSRGVAKNVVIDQDPLPGNTANPGATVTLTVSLGDVAQVPDLSGLPFETARARLTEAGFVVQLDAQTRDRLSRENPAFLAANPNLREGQVISQSLPAGSYQQRGATIVVGYYTAR